MSSEYENFQVSPLLQQWEDEEEWGGKTGCSKKTLWGLGPEALALQPRDLNHSAEHHHHHQSLSQLNHCWTK